MLSNSVRLIAGRFRRRVLRFPETKGLRPTPNRVRETLFNWLGQDLSGWHCLDLFAGSGALGFEASSRNAARVVLIEKNKKTHAALVENALLLKTSETLEIKQADALECATSWQKKEETFDLIFLDPPFHQSLIEKLLPLMPHLLKPKGLLYIEAESALNPALPWVSKRSSKAGDVYFHLWQRDD